MTFSGNRNCREFTLSDSERFFFNLDNAALKKFRWNVNSIPRVCLSDENIGQLEEWHYNLYFRNCMDVGFYFLNVYNEFFNTRCRQAHEISENEKKDFLTRVKILFEDVKIVPEIINFVQGLAATNDSFSIAIVLTPDTNKIHVQPFSPGLCCLQSVPRTDIEDVESLRHWQKIRQIHNPYLHTQDSDSHTSSKSDTSDFPMLTSYPEGQMDDTQSNDEYDNPFTLPSPANTQTVVFEATAANIQKIVLDSPVPVILDVYADQCGPSKDLVKMAIKGGGKFRIVQLNTVKEHTISSALEVTSLPTIFGIRDRKIVNSFKGMPRDQKFKIGRAHV